MSAKITSHFELEVYKKAVDAAMELFELSKLFPREEAYSMTDQMRRAVRSVCSNLAEAWRKRIYEAAFISKINDAEGEAAEAQTWIDFAVRSKYMDRDKAVELFKAYDEILRMLVAMRCNPDQWTIPPDKR